MQGFNKPHPMFLTEGQVDHGYVRLRGFYQTDGLGSAVGPAAQLNIRCSPEDISQGLVENRMVVYDNGSDSIS